MSAVQKEENPVITSGRNQNKPIKVALIVLGIILLVIVSEAAYYFYSKSAPSKTQEETETRTISEPTPIPTQKPAPSTKAINVEKAKAFVANFEGLKPKETFFDRATINVSVTGEVVRSYAEKTTINGLDFIYALELKNAIGQTLTYRFTQVEMASAYVVLTSPSIQQEIGIKQIQKGDKVNIKETINLLDERPDSRLVLEVRR